jgi:cytidine deaminase
LFFGLIGAVGTDLKAVGSKLTGELQQVGYTTKSIRLSAELQKFSRFAETAKHSREDERLDALMTAGDVFRREAGRGDAVGLLGVSGIRRLRREVTGNERKHADAQAYILHSLKRPEELRTLRSIYGSSFFVLSVFAPIATRTEALCRRFAESHSVLASSNFVDKARAIIDRDKKEVGTLLGQDVEATFPEADFFLDATETSALDQQITRFIEIIFGHPFVTPTTDEYGMFHAKAASLRSADLSRQVGAVIATNRGEILTTGCNEVPRSHGNIWEDVAFTSRDRRDFKLGYDSTARMKNEMLEEVFERLSSWLEPEKASLSPADLASKALRDGEHPPLKGTRIDNVLEFGRSVHAEMSALTEAARRGVSVLGARLFCTTFPCHMCARHIISAGLKEVIYIEPYPKSMAKNLYEDMLNVDNEVGNPEAVCFRPFVGLAPRRFIEFFQSPVRKNARGMALVWTPSIAEVRVIQIADYNNSELGVMKFLREIEEKVDPDQPDMLQISGVEEASR